MSNNFLLLFMIGFIFTITLTNYIIIVNAEDNIDSRCTKVYDESNPTIGKVECCDLDKEFVLYCTICDATNPPSNCSQRYPHIEYKEEPPTTDDPPIKSGDSVFPNNDEKVLDEQQPNPTSPLADKRFPTDKVGVLEQPEDSSANNQNSE